MEHKTNNNCCTVCKSQSIITLAWNYACPGESVFSNELQLNQCAQCTHIFLTGITKDELNLFYANESSYSICDHFSIDDEYNVNKYDSYARFIEPLMYSGDELRILDYGCGAGGFLFHLEQNYREMIISGKLHLVGFDADPRMREVARNNLKYTKIIEKGHLGGIARFDIITLFHVLEHTANPSDFLMSLSKNLHSGGHICLEVPDADGYSRNKLPPVFWLSIREHVQHFSPAGLSKLVKLIDFEASSIYSKQIQLSDFSYQGLRGIIRPKNIKTTSYEIDNLYAKTEDLTTEQIRPLLLSAKDSLEQFADTIFSLSQEYERIILWGMSSLAMKLLPEINPKNR